MRVLYVRAVLDEFLQCQQQRQCEQLERLERHRGPAGFHSPAPGQVSTRGNGKGKSIRSPGDLQTINLNHDAAGYDRRGSQHGFMIVFFVVQRICPLK